MDLNDFISAFADQFEDTDESLFTPDCEFHNLEEWSSLSGMAVIALAKIKYGKTVTGRDIKECTTIKDLFNLIASK